jgi:hypothetical protein
MEPEKYRVMLRAAENASGMGTVSVSSPLSASGWYGDLCVSRSA